MKACVHQDPKLVARLPDLGSLPKLMTPAELGQFMPDEAEKWRKVVDFAVVSADRGRPWPRYDVK
jgi:tripartite-type tricarboxylate transporter receptor subunit TctC